MSADGSVVTVGSGSSVSCHFVGYCYNQSFFEVGGHVSGVCEFLLNSVLIDLFCFCFNLNICEAPRVAFYA